MEWNDFTSFYIELILLDIFVMIPKKYRSSVTRTSCLLKKKLDLVIKREIGIDCPFGLIENSLTPVYSRYNVTLREKCLVFVTIITW